MHVVIKKIVCAFLLTYLFFCFALQAHAVEEKRIMLQNNPSYEELLQWHSLLMSFSSLQPKNADLVFNKKGSEKVALQDRDLDRLFAAIARGKKKPLLKYRYYLFLFFACYLSYKVVKATNWYRDCWSSFCDEFFSFFDFPFLDSWIDWFKGLFAYNPFAFLLDWFRSKEVLDELDALKIKYREREIELDCTAELQKKLLARLEKGQEAIQVSIVAEVQKQEEKTLLLQELHQKYEEQAKKVDERLATQETTMESLKRETSEAFTSLTDLLESAVDYASATKEHFDNDVVACKETIDGLKTVVEEQIEKVKANDQATLLKEVREVKEAITSLVAPKPKTSFYSERSKEPEKKAPEKKVEVVEKKVVEIKKEKEEEPGMGTTITESLGMFFLPKTMKVIQERRALENSLNRDSYSSSSKYR